MANTFKLKIITPHGVKFDGDVYEVTVGTSCGKISLLAKHADIVINTIPSSLLVTMENGEKITFFASDGILGFKNNTLELCCCASEREDEIDVKRAESAKERAEKRLKEKEFDEKRTELALARALARLKIKS